MHRDQLGLIQGVQREFSIRRSVYVNHFQGWDHSEVCEVSRVYYLNTLRLRTCIHFVPYALGLPSLSWLW